MAINHTTTNTVDEETRKMLNRRSRERIKCRLYQDILFDMYVCEIEGWDKKEYIRELQEMLNSIKV